jgi:hypothetical protein
MLTIPKQQLKCHLAKKKRQDAKWARKKAKEKNLASRITLSSNAKYYLFCDRLQKFVAGRGSDIMFVWEAQAARKFSNIEAVSHILYFTDLNTLLSEPYKIRPIRVKDS